MTWDCSVARSACSGRVLSQSLLALSLLFLTASCGSREPETPAERRVWEGPGSFVASSGLVAYERREIAQKLDLPRCIEVGSDRYGFVDVTPISGGGATPPGLTDTFFRLDRWRIWTRGGPIQGQPALFVTVRGSTGIIAEYGRLPPGDACPT